MPRTVRLMDTTNENLNQTTNQPTWADPSSEQYDESAATMHYAGVCGCGDFSCQAGIDPEADCVNSPF